MMMNDKEYRIGMVNLLFYYEFMMMMIVPMTTVFAPFVVHGATATRQHAHVVVATKHVSSQLLSS